MAQRSPRRNPWWLLPLCALVIAGLGSFALVEVLSDDDGEGGSTVAAQPAAPTQGRQRFPDYGYLPEPPAYTGPTFRLSQDYPARPPNEPLPPFFQTNFKQDWKTYLLQARTYCFAGMTTNDWRPERNQVRHWYHMPWQHYGQFGREGVHGLTKEAPIQPKQLAATQTAPGVTYAVGFYNAAGGYTIGRVWKDHDHPDPTVTSRPGPGFPNGTVVCKILFANFPPGTDVAAQVPFLVNPIEWDAYVTDGFGSCLDRAPTCNRSIQKATLIQMDVMVKDDRAPTKWLFGTFQYNGASNHSDPWENLEPLGVMWGNDPDVRTDAANPTPVRTIINPEIKESIINPDTTEIPPTHLGWNSRLNGPVDNPRSSCMSCHMTAESPQKSEISPLFEPGPPIPPGSDEWMRWFQDVVCTTPFDTGSLSTDNSLQLAGGIQNFYTWLTTKDGIYSPGSQLPVSLRADIDTIVRDKPVKGIVRKYLERP